MGFVSLLEDIEERHAENDMALWRQYVGSQPAERDLREARDVLGDPFERPKKVIRKFWAYYQSSAAIPVEPRSTKWENHLAHLRELEALLSPIQQRPPGDAGAWRVVCEVEACLREFFNRIGMYGPLSRESVVTVAQLSADILTRCQDVQKYLQRFIATIKELPAHEREKGDLHGQLTKLEGIRRQLDEDVGACDEYKVLTGRVETLWQEFLHLHTVLPLRLRYRPALKDLNRLRLHPDQDHFVTLNREGCYRVQGISGSGKTIILIHRALRLAMAHPERQTRLFTINRALAELLRATGAVVHGTKLPANLHISAMYDSLLGCVTLFEPPTNYRLADDKSGERINRSWSDFFETQRVFEEKKVRRLIQSIERQGGLTHEETGRYLRDEMIYIESAYGLDERQAYLTDRRSGRSIQLQPPQREYVLKVLAEWDHWRHTGGQCDIHGIAARAARYFDSPPSLADIRSRFPTHHVLIDEFQDFSTLELRIVRRLVSEPDSLNAFFFAGDLNQKVYVKQLVTTAAGFDFRGRADLLTQNYRNTRQILQAAYAVAEVFPPQADEPFDLLRPDYSVYEGGRPVAIDFGGCDHVARIVELIKLRQADRVAVVSENAALLSGIRQRCAVEGLLSFELLSNEDIDRWKRQPDNPLSPALVLSGLDAVKGFEFDTVIAADLSENVIPPPGIPQEERWRSAAVLYSALTRARDELVMTYERQPSIFLEAMRPHVDFVSGVDEAGMSALLR